jgi:hypothetical protein
MESMQSAVVAHSRVSAQRQADRNPRQSKVEGYMVIDVLHFSAGGGPGRTEFGRSLENPIHDEECLGCRAQLLEQGGVVDVGHEPVRKRTQLTLVVV